MFKKVSTKFVQYKRLTALLAVAVLVSFTIGADMTFAVEDTYQDTLQLWGRFISLIGSLINMLLWIVIKFIGDLLTNDFIFGAGIEDMLKSIWQTVRNFVNIAFVFVLLVIAFYNIVSIDPEKIPLKKSLGKVAIALILVNFSYFAAKVVLDVANVLTTAVFAIPRDIITDLQLSTAEMEDGDKAIHAKCYKKYYQGDAVDLETMAYDALPAENGSVWHNDGGGEAYLLMPTKCHIPNLIKIKLFKEGEEVANTAMVSAQYDEMKVLLYHQKYDDEGKPVGVPIELQDYDPTKGGTGYESPEDYNARLQQSELTANKFGRNTITMILAKTMFDLNKLTEISAISTTGFFGLTIGGMVNLLLLILYGTMFVAMFIVLIFRVVYLWICIAFSPLVALMFVFKDFGIDMPDEANISKLFIKYAFVPVKMGIALSVGVLMIFQANRQTLGQDDTLTLGERAADIQIPIDTLVNDSSIQKLMWNIATVAVVWIAIKWSLKDLSGPVQGIVDKITGYVGAMGEIAAKIPLTLPIAPYWEDKEGGERKMSTFGAVLAAIGPANLGAIQRDAIYGRDRKTAALNRDIAYKLDRITSDSQREDLHDITTDNSMMTQIMQTENKDVRESLADKLVMMGVLDKGKVDEWKGKDSSVGEFRNMLAEIKRPEDKEYFFGKNNPQTAWQTAGQSATAGQEVFASDSALFSTRKHYTDREWDEATLSEFETKQSAIDEKIESLENDKAERAIRSALKVEPGADGKLSATATAEVVDKAIKALSEIKDKDNAERERVEKTLSGQALELFIAAKGHISSQPATRPPADTPTQPPAGP